jgi:D-alanyl-lipoteichoic acid acyltransferase DltB (MBOAT superfamily)
VITNVVFENYLELPAITLILNAFLYTIQLYADFSGYTDMAIGISRLMGFSIAKNFDFPFFAQNIAEFWRKWHISLTTWLTDYVFTPLSIAFRDYGKWGLSAAIIINFTIIGIWHGANWTYVLFGFLHGCFFIPLIVTGTLNKKKKLAKDEILPSLREFLNMLGTFTLVMMSLIIFRSESISNAIGYLDRIFSTSILSIPKFRGEENTTAIISLFFIIIFIIVEWKYRFNDFVFNGISKSGVPIQLINIFFIVVALYFFSGSMKSYIYFNF